MIYLSFFMILIGSIVFIASLIGLVFRLVIRGRKLRGDIITKQILKFSLGGLCLVLFGQVIVWLAL
jgi:hypothetical protein